MRHLIVLALCAHATSAHAERCPPGTTLYGKRPATEWCAITGRSAVTHGYRLDFWPSNRKRTEGHYKDGKRHGVFRARRDDGKLESEEHYRDDKLHGRARRWHSNGRLASQRDYADGAPVGAVREWFATGKTSQEGSFKVGKPDGRWRAWGATTGKLMTERTYRDGVAIGTWRQWFGDGKPQLEGAFDDGKPDGRWQLYYATGTVALEGEYKDGKRTGIWTSRYPDGKDKESGAFDVGARDGHWTAWDGQGHVRYERDYAKGALTNWSEAAAAGKLVAKTDFCNATSDCQLVTVPPPSPGDCYCIPTYRAVTAEGAKQVTRAWEDLAKRSTQQPTKPVTCPCPAAPPPPKFECAEHACVLIDPSRVTPRATEPRLVPAEIESLLTGELTARAP